MNDFQIKKKRTYNSRVQFRAVQKEVEDKIAAGYRILPIYEELTQAGKLTISYTSFCEYIRGNGERKHNKKKKPAVAPVKQVAAPPPTPNKPKDDGAFHHEKNPNMDELVGPQPKEPWAEPPPKPNAFSHNYEESIATLGPRKQDT